MAEAVTPAAIGEFLDRLQATVEAAEMLPADHRRSIQQGCAGVAFAVTGLAVLLNIEIERADG